LVNQSIVQWLKQYLNSGYNLDSLEKTLLEHGYNQKDIDDAVRSVYGTAEIKHTIHLSKTTVAVVVAVIFSLLFITGGVLYFLTPKAPSHLLDVRTEVISSSILPGGKLEFNLELTSLGASKRYDVSVRYDIEKDGNKITFKEETVGVETSKSFRTFVNIPTDATPGEYLLKTIAYYEGRVARAVSSFKVIERSLALETCFDGIMNQGETNVDCGGPCGSCSNCNDGIQNQGEVEIDCGGPCSPCSLDCDDNDKCTEDLIIDGRCKFTAIIPCCGNDICEEDEVGECLADCDSDDPFAGMNTWQKLEALKELGATDDVRASNYCEDFDNNLHKEKCYADISEASKKDSYCEKINDERTKDECYITVAHAKGDHSICEKVVGETRKDRCYMHFATSAIDYSVCEKVIDYYLKQLCNSMKDLDNMPSGVPETG